MENHIKWRLKKTLAKGEEVAVTTEQWDNLLQCQYPAQTEEMKQQPGRLEEKAANGK